MIEENILLKDFSNYKIGGPAKFFLQVDDADNLENDLKEFREKNDDKIFILGGGTNVLFSDFGFNGLVIFPNFKYINKLDDEIIEVGSSVSVKEIVDFTIDNSLSGFEWAGGLPGTIGGAVYGNAGAFGGETKDSVVSVKSYDIYNNKIMERVNKDCEFAYRSSIYKTDLNQKEIIISTKIKFLKGDKEKIKQDINNKISHRSERQPLEYPNIGSTFKNVDLKNIPDEIKEKYKDKIKNDPFPVIPAAVFLSEANLKGERVGDIEISGKHPNFFVNLGNGKATDVLKLIDIAQNRVLKKFKVHLETEIIKVDY
jgi:UDP-N-acetylmuramate dehydrogenase